MPEEAFSVALRNEESVIVFFFLLRYTTIPAISSRKPPPTEHPTMMHVTCWSPSQNWVAEEAGEAVVEEEDDESAAAETSATASDSLCVMPWSVSSATVSGSHDSGWEVCCTEVANAASTAEVCDVSISMLSDALTWSVPTSWKLKDTASKVTPSAAAASRRNARMIVALATLLRSRGNRRTTV